MHETRNDRGADRHSARRQSFGARFRARRFCRSPDSKGISLDETRLAAHLYSHRRREGERNAVANRDQKKESELRRRNCKYTGV